MRKIYVKYSNNRNRYYSTKTSIIEEAGVRFVVKEPLFEEGKAHIVNMYNNAELLKKTYPDIKVCDAQLEGDSVKFEYIYGTSMVEEYMQYIQNRDKNGLLALIDRHCELIKGSKDNLCIFEESERSREAFGDLSHMVGKEALKACNFDAIAQNIFVTDKGYCFIDYEWVFDVPVPMELMLYHCIVDIAYVTMKGLNEVISRDELLEYLGIGSSIGAAWDNFYKHITEDEQGLAYERIKSNYEKSVFDLNGQLNSMRDERDKAKGEKFELELKALETMKFVDGLKLELEEQQKRAADAEGARYELELKALETMKYVDGLQLELEELRAGMEATKKELDDTKGAKFELELKALETMQYVDGLNSKIKNLNAMVDELNTQVDVLRKEATLKYQVKKSLGIKK